MTFQTLIALSEFEARFDDAMLRRPLVARRNPEAAGGGPASEPSRKPETPAIIPDDDAPQPGMLLPGIMDDAPRPVGDTPQSDLAAPRNPMVLPPKLDDAPQPAGDAPQPDLAAPRNPLVLPPKLDDAPQPVGDAPQPDTVAPANPMVLPPKLDDAPQPVGNATQPVGGAPQPAGDTLQPAGDAPQPVGDPPRPIGDAPQLVGDAPQPVGVAPQSVGVASKKALSPGGDDGPKLVDKSGSSIEVQLQHHKDTSAEVQALLQAYHQEVDAFQRRMNRYEQDVAAFNRGAGARPATAREQKRLVAEEAALQRLGRELNAQGEALQLADQWLRANASRINDRVASARANQRRTNRRNRAEFLREETPEGVITREDTDGDGKIDRKTLTDPDGNVASETQYHYADDGTIDRVVVTTPEGVETHLDTDGDGKFDQITLFDPEGNQTSDTVYRYADDGTIDRMVVTTAEGVETHLDTDGDGKTDQRTLTDLEGNQTSDTQYHFADDGTIDRMVVTTPEGVETHRDTDGDGKIDQKTLIDAEGNQTADTVYHYTDDGTIDRIVVTTPEGVETHLDTDGDGKIDQITLIDPEGNQTTNTEYHYTDDGTIDRMVVTTPEGVETHLDTDGDGKIDRETLTDPEGNQTSDTQYHFADDGKVDRITVTTPEGVRVHTDSDGDGKIDRETLTDPDGNQTSDTAYHYADDGTIDRITVTTPEGTRVHTDSNGDGKIDYVPDAGSVGDARELFELNDSGSKPPGRLTREQGTGNWYNASTLEDDSGINLVGPSYAVGENTIIADGTVSFGGGSTGRVRTTYTRNPDGTLTTQSRLINYYKDDAPGGGGGGGGSSRDYTVAADGTVSYTENGHTYTVSDDDLAQAVRDAVNTGDATGLSSVDTTTVTNSDGQVMAHSLSSTDAINAVVAASQGVFNPYHPTANNGTPHPESGQPVYFDSAGNAFYDAGLSNPVDDQAQAYFSGMLDTDRDGVPDSQDGVAGSMGNEVTVAVPDRFLPDAVRPAIPTLGDIQANAAALPAAAAARGIDTTGLSISEISQKVFIHDQTAFVEQFLGPDAVPDGQAPTREQLAQAQEMYDDDVASLNAQVQGFTIGRETSDVPPAGVEVGGRQGFDQGLALAELQADLQRVAEGKTSLTAVLAKWQADPRGSTLMLQGPRERLYGEEVGEYEGPPTEISATEWLSQAVAAETVQFENIFRQVTGREPSGDLARDADILSRYGGNAVTDMGYAGEVQAFEKEERERQEMILPGETGQIGTQVNIDPVTGTLQVSQGVAPIVQAQKEERERQEMILPGETGQIGTQVNIDPVTGTLQVSQGVAPIVQAQKEERERQEMILPGETGQIGTQVNIDPVTGALQVSPGVMPAVAASQAEERERRVAQLESKFRDEVLQTGDAPGGFVESVLDSQIEGGGLPTNHPDFPEYDQLRTEMDGPHWRREQIASATQQLLDDSTIWTIDIGPAKDAISALVTGRHVSNYDSSIPVPVNAGVLPVIGTLADANIRGADGYSRGDVAWLAGMGALDVLPIPGVGTLARTSKGAMVVIRNLPAAGGIATGGRRTLASVTQGTLKAPYQVTGTRPKPQGVSNIPVHMGGEVVVDGQLVPAWEGLLRQRDEALQQYRQTGMPQSIDLPTADGGIQTVWVGGSRAATSYGTGGMVHTSPMAGLLTELSQTPEGFVGKVKVGKSGQLLPDVEQRHFMTTQGVPAFREGSAFNKTLYEDPNFSPGYQTFVDRRNLADVEHVRKVFGGDVDTGVMRPSAVVELEGGVPQSKVIAGGPDKPPLYQEYPVGLQKTRGFTEHMYVDVPPDMMLGRWEVFRDNVLAEVDRLRGRTETFYVAHQNADGTIVVLRKADMDALAAAGVSLDDALRVRTRAGETRFIAPSQWDSAVRRFSTAAARGNDERHDFKNAQDRGLDNRDTFGAGVRTPNGNPPVGSVDVVGRPDGRYALGGDGPLRISAPAPTARLSRPLPGIARPTPSPIPMVEPQPDARVADPRIPDAHVPDVRVADPRIPYPRILDAHVPDARVADPRIPYPRIPDAHVPDVRVADPRIPYPRIPDARVADPRVAHARIPGIGTPDLTRQRRVRLPEVDEAPMTVVKAEEGLYPRVVAHDELIRVYHDLDTGEVRTEPLVLPTEPIIVKHDDTPPPIESRFAGHRRITPRGGYVFTKPVGERRRKASSKRHPYLRKGELRRG